jgi:hypothetical protein
MLIRNLTAKAGRHPVAAAALAVALLGAGPALAGKADFYVELTANSNVEKLLVATTPGAEKQHTVVRGQTRQFKLASIETRDDKSEETIQPAAHFPLFVSIAGYMSNISCEVKSPTVPVTLVHNGGDALVKTKVTASANGCQMDKTICEGAACKK